MHIEEAFAIRRYIKNAWLPFFTRFGKLTPVQIQAIPAVMRGANVVIASPTASGKTEAIVAPLAERFIQERWNSLAILYIVPTRALANDTLERIQGPLSDMGISAAIKHGDKPYLTPRNWPNCLITTPESLDSLICRRPQVFSALQATILDEIHLLHNTYRGDQLRILLKRLCHLARNARQYNVYLLSATLSEPEIIARRYVEEFDLVIVPGTREIDYYFLESYPAVHGLAQEQGWKKILCFCNLRESVEKTATELADIWHPYPVVSHHGSLNRRIREEAETVMKEMNVAVCVATSTLEVGIDIGDVDLVLLAEMPWSISSLLQRIGRGNRRESVIHVAVVTNSEEERSMMQAMFTAAKSGSLPPEEYVPDLSVVVQQVFSCLYQQPYGMSETELVELLSPICFADDVQIILTHLQQRGWIERKTHGWVASTKLMDLGEKGRIHSNIPDSQMYRVFDIDSGKEIGEIAGVFDQVFVLGRSTWRVVSVSGDVIRARRFKGQAETPLFQRCGGLGAFDHLLPQKLRAAKQLRLE